MRDSDYFQEAGLDPATGSEVTAPVESASPTAAPTEAATAEEMFSFYVGDKAHQFPISAQVALKHAGEEKRIPLKDFANTYRQASHLQETQSKFKQEREEFLKQKADSEKWKGFYDKWSAMQEWSEKNPEQAQRLMEIYSQKDKHLLEHQVQTAGGQPGQPGQEFDPRFKPFIEEITGLKGQLDELKSWKSQWDQEQVKKQEEADVEAVKGEVRTFQEKYPHIDMNEPDQDGVKLWAKIMNYGVQNGIPTFKAAALEMLEDRLIDNARFTGRTESVNQIKEDKRQGIVAKSPTPFNQGQSTGTTSHKGKSYNDLANEAKAEYEAMLAQG